MIHIGTKTFSNTADVGSEDKERNTKVIAQYDGGPYNNKILGIISDRLLASLFYIKLYAQPRFYDSTARCMLALKCRLPPGPSLLDLSMKLFRGSAYISYRGLTGKWHEETLYTQDIVRSCRNGEKFHKTLEIDMSSNGVFDIRIGGLPGGGKEAISNSPYPIKQLIHDQGLGCVHGRRGDRKSKAWKAQHRASNNIGTDLDKLHRLLGLMID